MHHHSILCIGIQFRNLNRPPTLTKTIRQAPQNNDLNNCQFKSLQLSTYIIE